MKFPRLPGIALRLFALSVVFYWAGIFTGQPWLVIPQDILVLGALANSMVWLLSSADDVAACPRRNQVPRLVNGELRRAERYARILRSERDDLRVRVEILERELDDERCRGCMPIGVREGGALVYSPDPRLLYAPRIILHCDGRPHQEQKEDAARITSNRCKATGAQ